jgi:hypothetical protein
MSYHYCYNNKILYRNYEGCDTHKCNIPEYPNGLDKHKTLAEVIKIAMQINCCVVTKNGKGKWYIKAKKICNNYEKLQDKLNIKYINKIKSDKRNHCYLLKYDNNQDDSDSQDDIDSNNQDDIDSNNQDDSQNSSDNQDDSQNSSDNIIYYIPYNINGC